MKKTSIFVIVLIITLAIIAQFVYANSREPGSSEDPIVTLSYVEQRIQQLKVYIDDKASSSPSPQPQPSEEPLTTSKIDIVFLKIGERLIAEEGAEIILRGGTAVAIDSPSGGLANVTAGRDIQKNQSILPNHLHIVPKSDGRGVRAMDDHVILMVRGVYRTEK
ncbi:hypothetical protein [Clostridium formicaceticum]|uniref:SAF domain-containing protein n=1 Tax=Clostridium formicaceticum TaxID=1497 RepID=A0AAC9WHL1_9CLOT|nr:hypothetical protein [Clostridium formicaceticum]AOY74835.1 hypothetical protein BJL90_02005 [Clostridium formicaceticum]ARE89232.1 hypothetical protein CLFO_36390 [Clostridium formicaceticum]